MGKLSPVVTKVAVPRSASRKAHDPQWSVTGSPGFRGNLDSADCGLFWRLSRRPLAGRSSGRVSRMSCACFPAPPAMPAMTNRSIHRALSMPGTSGTSPAPCFASLARRQRGSPEPASPPTALGGSTGSARCRPWSASTLRTRGAKSGLPLRTARSATSCEASTFRAK